MIVLFWNLAARLPLLWWLLGAVPAPARRAPSTLQVVLSVAGVLAGLALTYKVWTLWQEIHEEDDEEPVTNKDLLAEFERAYAAGELDDDEFRRVTAALGKPRPGPPPKKEPAPDAPPPGPEPPAP